VDLKRRKKGRGGDLKKLKQTKNDNKIKKKKPIPFGL
jgi:hypothetical protein